MRCANSAARASAVTSPSTAVVQMRMIAPSVGLFFNPSEMSRNLAKYSLATIRPWDWYNREPYPASFPGPQGIRSQEQEPRPRNRSGHEQNEPAPTPSRADNSSENAFCRRNVDLCNIQYRVPSEAWFRDTPD